MAEMKGPTVMLNWFKGSKNRLSTASVAIGERFRERSEFWDKVNDAVWVVENVRQIDTSPFPLVYLRREGVNHMKKVVSLAALEKGFGYAPEAPAALQIRPDIDPTAPLVALAADVVDADTAAPIEGGFNSKPAE